MRLEVHGEGCPHIPSATVDSEGRHLAASLAWDATLAAARCPLAPLLTASTAVGSSRCSCPELLQGETGLCFLSASMVGRAQGRDKASSGLLSLLVSGRY